MLCTYFAGSHPAPSFNSTGRVAIAVVVVPEHGLPQEHVKIKTGLTIEEAHWEALLLGLSVGRDFGFSSLALQCSRKNILNTMAYPGQANDPMVEAKRQKALELSKRYDSVRYFHCRSAANPAVATARRFFQDRIFRIAATLRGRQTLCLRAPTQGHALRDARTETWPTLDQLVRLEGLYLDDLDIQDVKPVAQGEYEVGATAHLRFELLIEDECLDAAEARGPGFSPQLLELACQYGLDNPELSLWSASECQ